MKKIYSKPLVKKFRKGQLSEKGRSRWHEVHTTFIKYGIESEDVSTKPKKKLNQQLFKNQIDKLPRTFSTEYTPKQLKQLRQSLIEENFICDNISENQFIYIFTGQLITDRMTPIKWKIRWGGKMSLRCFLELLLLPVHKNQVRNCFIDADSKPFLISKPNGKISFYHKRLKKIVYNI